MNCMCVHDCMFVAEAERVCAFMVSRIRDEKEEGCTTAEEREKREDSSNIRRSVVDLCVLDSGIAVFVIYFSTCCLIFCCDYLGTLVLYRTRGDICLKRVSVREWLIMDQKRSEMGLTVGDCVERNKERQQQDRIVSEKNT